MSWFIPELGSQGVAKTVSSAPTFKVEPQNQAIPHVFQPLNIN
jgi:hypothetical protein